MRSLAYHSLLSYEHLHQLTARGLVNIAGQACDFSAHVISSQFPPQFSPSMVFLKALWLCAIILSKALCQPAQDHWIFPQALSAVTLGRNFTVRWEPSIREVFSTYCPPCDTTLVDLWVQTGHNTNNQYPIAGI